MNEKKESLVRLLCLAVIYMSESNRPSRQTVPDHQSIAYKIMFSLTELQPASACLTTLPPLCMLLVLSVPHINRHSSSVGDIQFLLHICGCFILQHVVTAPLLKVKKCFFYCFTLHFYIQHFSHSTLPPYEILPWSSPPSFLNKTLVDGSLVLTVGLRLWGCPHLPFHHVGVTEPPEIRAVSNSYKNTRHFFQCKHGWTL